MNTKKKIIPSKTFRNSTLPNVYIIKLLQPKQTLTHPGFFSPPTKKQQDRFNHCLVLVFGVAMGNNVQECSHHSSSWRNPCCNMPNTRPRTKVVFTNGGEATKTYGTFSTKIGGNTQAKHPQNGVGSMFHGIFPIKNGMIWGFEPRPYFSETSHFFGGLSTKKKYGKYHTWGSQDRIEID